MSLPLLSSSDVGAPARDKINAAISKASLVDEALSKAGSAEAIAAAARDNLVGTKAYVDEALTKAGAAVALSQEALDDISGTKPYVDEALSKAGAAQYVAGQAKDQSSTAMAVALAARAVSEALTVSSPLRPGDGLAAFTVVSTLSALSGEAGGLPLLPSALVGFNESGGVARIKGQGILAAREADPIEEGRVIEVRASLRRRANPSDPNNDTVRVAVLWLDQAKTVLPGAPGAVIADFTTLRTSSGRQSACAYIARGAAAGVTIVAPPGAAYFRRVVLCYGLDGVTDIEVLASSDLTRALIPPAVTVDFQGRLTAVESTNGGPRLQALEAAVASPHRVGFTVRSDAQSASIATTVQTITLVGYDAPGDGFGGNFNRVAALASGVPGFATADGALWQLAPDGFTPSAGGGSGSAIVKTRIETRLRDEMKLRDFIRGISDPALRLQAVHAAFDRAKSVVMDDDIVEVSDTLRFRPGIRIIGNGRDASRFRLVKPDGAYAVPLAIVPVDAPDVQLVNVGFDHNAERLVQPPVSNMLAMAIFQGILAQGQGFQSRGCGVYNSWDNGLGIGSLNWNGTGTPSDPYVGVPGAPQPKRFMVSDLYGENNGCGTHNLLLPAQGVDERGKKGGVLNILNAASGTASNIVGSGNYNGVIVDLGGGADVVLTNAMMQDNKRDANFPNNGSGIDYFLDSGPLLATNIQSKGSRRYGVCIPANSGQMRVTALVHAALEHGVVVDGCPNLMGHFVVTDCRISAPGTYDAVRLNGVVDTHLSIIVQATGTSHRYLYSSTYAAGKRNSGRVILSGSDAQAGPYNVVANPDRDTEVVEMASGSLIEMLGRELFVAPSFSYKDKPVGDLGNNYGVAVQAAGTKKRVALTYDNVNDLAILQALEAGVSQKPLALNPSGGDVMLGPDSLARDATRDFLHLPSMNGKPLGVPVGHASRVPMIVDTANGRVWLRFGDKWKYLSALEDA